MMIDLMMTLVHPRVLVGSMLLIFFVVFVVLLCFVCFRPVSCVPNVASVDCFFFRFISRLFILLTKHSNFNNIQNIDDLH